MPQENPFIDWGGYMNVKISKLENQVANSSNFYKQSNLFDGISIFVNGWTNPTADELKRIMMTYGGTYHHYERKHTTFVIAENLPDVKIRNMNTSNVISPKWVVDCIKANKILDYTKYLLYTNQKRSQPALFFKKASNSEIYETSMNLSLKRKFSSMISSENDNDELRSKIKYDSPQNTDFQVIKNDNEDEKFAESADIKPTDSTMALEALNNRLFKENVKTEINSFVEITPEQPIKNENNSVFKVAKTAKDPKFLSEFYNNSRLHHIATLGAGFKQYVTELREAHDGNFPMRKNILQFIEKQPNFNSVSTVMHIDMDCFFVSVGLKKYPELRGSPVAVTHSKGGSETQEREGVNRQQELELYMKRLGERLEENIMSDKKDRIQSVFNGKESMSEIASCSYEARAKGVKNGMFVGQALKLCPELKTIPYDFEGYKEVAFQLYNTVAQYTLDIEAVSCDEMFVDLSSLLKDIEVDAMDFVTYLRNEVKQKTGCPCSAGVGGNRLQARMATKKAKPDGQFWLNPETVLEYMSNIPIKDLPGVGFSTGSILKQLNLRTCGDLQTVTLPKLQMEFGKKFGETLYQFCRGIDKKPLVYGQIRKSVSAEVNYGIRFEEYTELETFLKQLCEEVHSRLLNIKRKGKCITLKVLVRAKEAPVESAKYMGHGYCDSQNKSVTLSDFTNDLETITRTVLATMKSLNIPPKELRGLGIHISKLDDPNDYKKSNILKNMFTKVVEKQKEKQYSEILDEESKDKNQDNFKIATETKSNINSFFSSKPKLSPDIKEATKSSPDTKQKTPPEKNEYKIESLNKVIKTPEKTNPSKGRGKPSKSLKINTNNVKPNQTIVSMFQNLAERQSSIPHSYVPKFYKPNEIDLNVLSELPEDIQKEIMNENGIINFSAITTNKMETPKINNTEMETKKAIDVEFLNALPEHLRIEIEQEMNETSNNFTSINKLETTTSINKIETINHDLNKIQPNENDLSEAGPSTN